MKLAPNSVSGRVVKISRLSLPPSMANRTLAPRERPIQLRCISRTFSGQPSRRSSASTRSSA